MTQTPEKDLPFVEGELTYLVPMSEKPYTYTFDRPGDPKRTNQVFENRKLPIHDARALPGHLSIDREGFELLKRPSTVRDFYDEDELRRIYYPETQRIIAEATGANRVVVFDHTIRRRLPGVADRTAGQPRQPATHIHNDYTLKSGPQRVRDVMGDEAETLLKHRFALINLWRPITGPLRDAPLAFSDARTVADRDFIASELIYPDRTGEIFQVVWSPSHRWFYVPEMRPDEALLIKCYDSLTDGTARFSAHTAFVDPTAPKDILPRESIEIRTIAFYDA